MCERSFSIQLDWRKSGRVLLQYFHTTRHEHAELRIGPTDINYLAWLRVVFAVRAEEEIEKAITVAVGMSGYPMHGKPVAIEELSLG